MLKQTAQKSGRINKKLVFGIGILSVILLLSYVSAFAVSSTYWSGNPLKISPGESTEITITLQNMAGSENITVRVSISEGSEIAEIINLSDKYSIPLGEMKSIPIKITIPEDAKIGNSYNVKLSVTTIEAAAPGAFAFGSSIEQNIPVQIISNEKPTTVEKKETPTPWIVYLLVGIIILIIIILLLRRRRK